jgi:hypothetical protein
MISKPSKVKSLNARELIVSRSPHAADSLCNYHARVEARCPANQKHQVLHSLAASPITNRQDKIITSFEELKTDSTDITAFLMPVPFGFSVGNFLAVAELASTISKALSVVRGSEPEYKALVNLPGSLNVSLRTSS